MHPIPREKLRYILEHYGEQVSLDPRRCEAFLRDLCGEFRKEIFVLTSAAREGIPKNLQAAAGMPIATLLARESRQMHDNLGISEELCTWAVESWAYALGLAAARDVRSDAHCPACDAKLRVHQKYFGRQAKCPRCLSPLLISVAGVPSLRSEANEPAVFTTPPNDELAGTPAIPEIETADSESAEDVFRQVVAQTIQSSGGFQPEHLQALDEARASLGISYDVSRRILNEVTLASLTGLTHARPPHSQGASATPSEPFANNRTPGPPPVTTQPDGSVRQLDGPPPVIVFGAHSATPFDPAAAGFRPTLFIGPDGQATENTSWGTDGENLTMQPPIMLGPSLEEVRRKVARPAAGLILTGALTMLIGCLMFVQVSAQAVPPDSTQLLWTGLPILISLSFGFVTILGSFKMLRLESYPFAMTAAVLAMAPGYCCVVGLPIGIWAVNVLNEHDVRIAFTRQAEH